MTPVTRYPFGVQLLFSGAIPGEADERGVTALLGVLDVASGRVVHRCEYRPSAAPADQKVQFTGFCFEGDRLYVCSFGEILVFDEWPPRRPAGRISHPGFNDLHHCHPWQGGLAVANTGLETVDVVSAEGELLERWDLLAGEPGARRIDPSLDYRLVGDTKPHRRHVNHLFDADGALWATQLRSGDAIQLAQPERRIKMGVGMPHDGCWLGERLVFTTTNGHLVLADTELTRSVNLSELTPGAGQLGWCRGVCAEPGDPERLFVGFSSLRRSRWGEFGYWIKWGQARPRSRISLYDLRAGSLEREWTLGDEAGWVVFQLEVLPPERRL